jgi:hypothetical protein
VPHFLFQSVSRKARRIPRPVLGIKQRSRFHELGISR